MNAGAGGVTVVDYGRGNLLSVRRAFEEIGAHVTLTDDPDLIAGATRLVVPGVGTFGDAMSELRRRGLIEPIKDFAHSGRPMLGICVGMQILFQRGEEFGEHAGLGLLEGSVRPIPNRAAGNRVLKIPHIGWNRLIAARSWDATILDGFDDQTFCYFVHSYAAQPGDPSDSLAEINFGEASLAALVQRDNIWGCQFHPEKSGPAGLRIVSNFANLPVAA